MSARKPLVIDDVGQLEQLQQGDELDIPLEEKVELLEARLDHVLRCLAVYGIQIPDHPE